MTPTLKAIRRFYLVVVIQSALLTMAPAALRAQDETPDGYVTRKEYEELKTQLLAMKKELDTLKKEKEVAPRQKDRESQSVAGTAPKRETAEGQAIADVHKQVAPEVTLPVVQPEGLLGTTKFLLAGWADGMFEARNGQVSTFSASFDPIFLWELTPKILFDSRLEIDPSGGGTNVNLVNAQISYLLNDYMALGAGEFFSPSNVFVERFEAQWINKLPDRPLAIYHGILPNISVGAQARGGVSDRLDPRRLRRLCFQRSRPEYFRRSQRGCTGFQQLHG